MVVHGTFDLPGRTTNRGVCAHLSAHAIQQQSQKKEMTIYHKQDQAAIKIEHTLLTSKKKNSSLTIPRTTQGAQK